MRRRNSYRTPSHRAGHGVKRGRVRRLLFDSLEDRRLLAGLQVFVYDDANHSGSWESESETPMAEIVVFLDRNADGQLGSNEPYQVTDAAGGVSFADVSEESVVQLLGSSTPGLTVKPETLAAGGPLAVAGRRRLGNTAPLLEASLTVSVPEDTALELPRALLAQAASDSQGDRLSFFALAPAAGVDRGVADRLTRHGQLTWSVESGGSYQPVRHFFGRDELIVRAYDGQAWSTPMTISIDVLPVDDPPTTIDFAAFAIPENEAGYLLGEVGLSDIDGGPNEISVTPGDLFEVKQGKIKLLDGLALNYESQAKISLEIMVNVGMEPTAVLSRLVNLTVIDRNDAPEGLDFVGLARVEEFIAGYEFGTVAVLDEDVGEAYDFSVSDPRFEVVAGVLKLKAGVALVFADQSLVPITITATSAIHGDRVSQSLDIQVVRAAPPWQNRAWAMDVNEDGQLTPLDVLVVINALNRLGVAPLDRPPPAGSSTFVDVNGDRVLTPMDALILINALNRQDLQGSGSGGPAPAPHGGGNREAGEGEGELPAPPATPKPSSLAASATSERSDWKAVTDEEPRVEMEPIGGPEMLGYDIDSLAEITHRRSARRVR
jgi:hypothetical protein